MKDAKRMIIISFLPKTKIRQSAQSLVSFTMIHHDFMVGLKTQNNNFKNIKQQKFMFLKINLIGDRVLVYP